MLNRIPFVGQVITLRNLRFRCMYFWSIKSLVKLKGDEMPVPTKVIWMFAKEVCYIISVACSTIILRPPKSKQEKQLYTVVARLEVTARWQTTIAMNISYMFFFFFHRYETEDLTLNVPKAGNGILSKMIYLKEQKSKLNPCSSGKLCGAVILSDKWCLSDVFAPVAVVLPQAPDSFT